MAASPAHVLYTYPNNSRAFKGLIAARYGNVAVEERPVEMGVTNKSAEFLALNPNGKVPTLVTPHGGIFESNAIAVYLARVANAGLLGASAYEEGLVHAWISWTASEVDLPRSAWLYPIFGYLPYSAAGLKQAKADIAKAMGVMNGYLATRTYLVGEAVTLADIVVACAFLDLMKAVLEAPARAEAPHFTRWFMTIVNQPQFKAVAGATELCTKAMVYDASKAAAAAAPKEDKKKDAPKAKAAPAKSAMEEAEEEAAAAERAPKTDEFTGLAASNFDLEQWKKQYSNTDTRTEAMPWLWSHFDAAGFSMYFCQYKYNNELTVPFKASNLVGGMFQRINKTRKYAFASMLITGTENNLQISGVWIFRGQNVPAMLIEECDDIEHYTWTKMDTTADRAKIEDYMAWSGASLPGDVCDGKNYK
eukprot:a775_3252.p2 GENE.a775_3252~~a775_3252.p2  ORF type:complete len:432 (-),score=213.26 a775_3252:37-1296(-)